MDYAHSWSEGREDFTLFLDRDQGDGCLYLGEGYADEEDIATVYYSGATLHGVVWRGPGSAREEQWKAAQLRRVAAVVAEGHLSP